MTEEIFLNAIISGDAALVAQLLATNPALASTRGADGVSCVLTALYHRERDIAQQVATVVEDSLDIFDAAALGDTARISALLNMDAELAATWSADGFQAIHLAAFFGQPEAVELLLDRGASADTQARHHFGVRPLHAALASGNAEKAFRMAQALRARGADINAQQGGGEKGFTPLMEAAQNGDEVLVRWLLFEGANRSIQTEQGKNAFDLAREAKREAVVALLS